MTTTFKISFEFSFAELQDLYGALISAKVAIMQKRDDVTRSHADRKYYEIVSNTLDDFVANFNPAKFLND